MDELESEGGAVGAEREAEEGSYIKVTKVKV